MSNKKDSQKLPKQAWHLVDAKDQVLGRLAVRVAELIRGKHKVDWAPHLDAGDFVVLINADQIHLSGKKWEDKSYYSHSRYIGSLKEAKAKALNPEVLIRKTVQGMLPKNKLRDKMMKKLKIYRGSEHPHKAQNPQGLN
ncbi:MAG: 50S ribosomal protein L13 [Bdellovibrionales bacterium]|nr:50S ribosomal protein L13 [Bdellovibrionales bacterium]